MVETDVFKLKLLNFCISASRLYILLKLLQFISSMQMKLSSSSLSTHSTLTQAFLTFKTLFNTSLLGWLLSADLLTFNSSKTEFLLIGLKNQLAKIQNSSLDTSHSAHNLGFIFDKHLTVLSLTKLHLSLQSLLLSHSSTSLQLTLCANYNY